jgi:archaeosine synthase
VDLSDGTASLRLEWTIPAPEVSGTPGSAQSVAADSWLLHWPLSAAQWSEIEQARPALVILSNARTLLSQGEPFVQAIRETREHLGVDPVLWAPRVAIPHRLAVLTYFGVDLVDTTATEWAATEGTYFDVTSGSAEPEAVPERRSCTCAACRAAGAPDRTAHGLALLDLERRAVAHALATGRLRELVEARLVAEPLLAELLRYGDGHLAQLLDQATPVVGRGIRTYILQESHRRPEVRRYQERFQTRYRPPSSKDVLLLVPCSKTKPYRYSRSHRRFLSALEPLAGAHRIHVVSATSPLGLVPRELEDVPPARHYDIPVTGDWNETERRAVREALERLVSVGSYRRLIVHLDEDEYSFLRSSVPAGFDPAWTVVRGHSTSSESLARLREAASAALSESPGSEPRPLEFVREELESIARFQFGETLAGALFSGGVRIEGRPWFQRLTDGKGIDLATWREGRGLFQLTVAGGRRMLGVGADQVHISDGVTLSGDLFTPGIVAADPAIRAGDAVLLTRHGALLGVGEAEMAGPWMERLPKGLAVTVRHRVRAAE